MRAESGSLGVIIMTRGRQLIPIVLIMVLGAGRAASSTVGGGRK